MYQELELATLDNSSLDRPKGRKRDIMDLKILLGLVAKHTYMDNMDDLVVNMGELLNDEELHVNYDYVDAVEELVKDKDGEIEDLDNKILKLENELENLTLAFDRTNREIANGEFCNDK